MKKLMTLLFSFVLVFSLAMPIFAQDTGTTESPKTERKEKKAKKEKKARRARKEKKEKMDKMATPDAPK